MLGGPKRIAKQAASVTRGSDFILKYARKREPTARLTKPAQKSPSEGRFMHALKIEKSRYNATPAAQRVALVGPRIAKYTLRRLRHARLSIAPSALASLLNDRVSFLILIVPER